MPLLTKTHTSEDYTKVAALLAQFTAGLREPFYPETGVWLPVRTPHTLHEMETPLHWHQRRAFRDMGVRLSCVPSFHMAEGRYITLWRLSMDAAQDTSDSWTTSLALSRETGLDELGDYLQYVATTQLPQIAREIRGAEDACLRDELLALMQRCGGSRRQGALREYRTRFTNGFGEWVIRESGRRVATPVEVVAMVRDYRGTPEYQVTVYRSTRRVLETEWLPSWPEVLTRVASMPLQEDPPDPPVTPDMI